MATGATPHFHNTDGHRSIEIGVKEFMCVGAAPPNDHPHVFLDMGDDEERICPYCSTLYHYNPKLQPQDTQPEGCLFREEIA